MSDRPNQAERRRWNDDNWLAIWKLREPVTNAVTELLLDDLDPNPGARLLDIGSGGGRAALAAAARVGASGSVLGADISAPLVVLANERGVAGGVTNARFIVADVQTDRLPGAPFSAAMSQFGVMFFDDPETAFANVLDQLEPAARLVFACWQPLERNPWHLAHVTSRFQPPVPPPAPGKHGIGAFSLANQEETTSILETAGFAAIKFTPVEETVAVERSAVFADSEITNSTIEPEQRDAVLDAIEKLLSDFRRADGRYDLPLALYLISATKPAGGR